MDQRKLKRVILPVLLVSSIALTLLTSGRLPEAGAQAPSGSLAAQLATFDSQYASCNGSQANITDLANSLMNWFPWTQEVDPSLTQIVTGRCADTEVAFEAHQISGITETNFVSAFNSFAIQVGAGTSAQISLLELRTQRVMLQQLMPNLVGGPITNPTAGATMNTHMSGLEAEFMLLDMINLKMTDPNYQVTPDQWESNLESAQAQKYQTLANGGTISIPPPQVQQQQPTANAAQMETAVDTASVSLGSSGMDSLINSTLNSMGLLQ